MTPAAYRKLQDLWIEKGFRTLKDLLCYYNIGDTKFLEHTPETALVHDLENVGDTTLRFVTVELLNGSTP